MALKLRKRNRKLNIANGTTYSTKDAELAAFAEKLLSGEIDVEKSMLDSMGPDEFHKAQARVDERINTWKEQTHGDNDALVDAIVEYADSLANDPKSLPDIALLLQYLSRIIDEETKQKIINNAFHHI